MNLTFKKVVLLSVLVVLLGVSLVYAFSIGFKPADLTRKGDTTTFTFSGEPPPVAGYLFVFAYDGDDQSAGSSSFVQASVTITGREYHNGSTSTDPQNPLRFLMMPGEYSVSATYNDTTRDKTVNVTRGRLSDAFFNFGSSPLPSLGHIAAKTWHITRQPSGQYLGCQIQPSITIAGPEDHSITSSTGLEYPLVFTVVPGEYSITATYDSTTKNETISVTAGNYSFATIFFGDVSIPLP